MSAGPAKNSSNLKSQGPFNVIPNPFASAFDRHRTYSLKPPGPAHMSTKYSNSDGDTNGFWKQSYFHSTLHVGQQSAVILTMILTVYETHFNFF